MYNRRADVGIGPYGTEEGTDCHGHAALAMTGNGGQNQPAVPFFYFPLDILIL